MLISLKTSDMSGYFQFNPKALAKSIIIFQSSLASPGGTNAFLPICTCLFVLVKVPFFSAAAEAGKIISANHAVSVINMSWTTICSNLTRPSRVWFWSGSDIAGFSPITYMPLIRSSITSFSISTTVKPFFLSNLCPQKLSILL